jgi:MFS family permease
MYEFILQVPVLDMPWEEFALLFITALAGGAFGAAIGALPAFIFTGFVVFLGEGLAILNRGIAATAASDAGYTSVTSVIGFGAITGPHIAFAGGVAASAYAGKKYPEMEPSGWDYHFGKNILYAFGTKPDILAVGAIFGLLGMLINRVGGALLVSDNTGFTDTIALSVVLTAVIARVVFRYPVVGSPNGSGFLDMSPFEREDPHPKADGGSEEHAGRLATEPWLPHQYKWAGVATIGLVGGILGGYIWLRTGSIFLGYGISAISLLFLNLGVEKIPVTHHITLLGSVGAMVGGALLFDGTAAAYTGIAQPWVVLDTTTAVVALLAAGVFGAISGLLGELTQRIMYSHSGTHVDPPAMAIAIMMLVIGVLAIAGVIPTAGYL